jgi:hypothetical protein
MDLFSRKKLAELARAHGETCVSLFMPTYHVESELSQNPIRLKNLIKQTRQELHDSGQKVNGLDSMLKPLNSLLASPTFWLDQSDGFAAFLTEGSSRVFRLPLNFEELVVTGDRFHLKPLFPLMAANNRFYVLALSKNRVNLYQGTHYSISQVESTDIPKNILEVIFDEVEDRSLQLHTANIVGGRHDAAFHGRGVTSDDDDHRPHDKLVRFFREIDHGLGETLGDESAPLLLAGVEYYLPIYKEVSSYKHLIDDTIVQGNPDHLKPRDLHARAWELVAPRFFQSQKTSIERFNQFTSNGQKLASRDIHEIVPGAVYGRVDTLFVEINAHIWGSYDQTANTIEIHETHETGDQDLLNLAAVQTFLQGGTVHALRTETMPVETGVAAIFRFPADVAADDQ